MEESIPCCHAVREETAASLAAGVRQTQHLIPVGKC